MIAMRRCYDILSYIKCFLADIILIRLAVIFILTTLSFVCFAVKCDPPKTNGLFSDSFVRSPDRVNYLPGWGCVNDLELAGTLPIKKTQNKITHDEPGLFYWFVESRHPMPNSPLVLWLNGGPGASSMYGFFMETGPYKVTENQTLIKRKSSWTEVANYLVIDQPAGVGLSWGEKNTYANESEAMDQLYQALLAFFERHKELASRPLYIAGESYAGKYIPELSMRILSGNNKNQTIPLRGIMIGDGWVNPKIQQSSNAEFAYAHGLIDRATYKNVTALYLKCAEEIDKKTPSTRAANQLCGQMQALIQKESGGLNLANLYKGKEPSDAYLTDYLNRKDVRQILHVMPKTRLFNTFSSMVSDKLEIGEQDSVAPLYETLLKHKIRVLIYNGLDDAKDCNFMGTDKWLSVLVWPYQQAFSKANTCVWRVNHKVAGYVKTANLLTQIKIRHAGHLAPIDQPEVLLNMFQQFINEKPYC